MAVVLVWIVHYLWGVRRVRLHHKQGDSSSLSGRKEGAQDDVRAQQRLQQTLLQCPSLSAVYWPTWYAHIRELQILLLGFKELRTRLQRSPYSREVLTLRDGGQVALDWVNTAPRISEALPVCVLLHGGFQDSHSATMTDIARSLAARGHPVVVMNRRGYGGGYGGVPLFSNSRDSPRLALFGLDEDLDEVMLTVGKRHPGRLVALMGFSCGGAFASRYVGTHTYLSAWRREDQKLRLQRGNSDASMVGAEPKDVLLPHRNLSDVSTHVGEDSDPEYQDAGATPMNEDLWPRVLCCACWDCGYDTSPDGSVNHIEFPYSVVVNWALKYWYAFRLRVQLRTWSPEVAEAMRCMLNPRHGLLKTYRALAGLSGAGERTWADLQQLRLNAINVPTLFLHSRDDPICSFSNVEASYEDLMANPNVAVVELRRGAHGCKYGFWGGKSILEDIVGDFVAASWRQYCATSVD